MSYATILQSLATVLESLSGLPVGDEAPFDAGFIRLDAPLDAKDLSNAQSFRRFVLDAGEVRSVSRVSTGREYSAACVLTVLYPRSRSRAFDESFVEGDMDLIRQAFEDPDQWPGGVRLISYQGSDAPIRERHVTKAVHRFTVDWIEP